MSVALNEALVKLVIQATKTLAEAERALAFERRSKPGGSTRA